MHFDNNIVVIDTNEGGFVIKQSRSIRTMLFTVSLMIFMVLSTGCGKSNKTTHDIDVPKIDKDSITVYEQTLFEISDESLTEFAELVFDGGEYEVIKPYEACNKKEC